MFAKHALVNLANMTVRDNYAKQMIAYLFLYIQIHL